MMGYEIAHAPLKGLGRGWPDLQAKAPQHAPQAHLDIMALGLQELAGGQKGPDLLGGQRLAVHGAKPAQPHQLGDAAGVLTIRLDRHGLERRADMARLEQFHRQAGRLHLGKEPLRQRPRLQAHARHRCPMCGQPGDQRLRLAGHLGLLQDLTLRIHDAHARAVQRHVNPGKLLHGRPSMMHGAGESPSPLFNTTTLREHHQSPERLGSTPARYPI